jgi:hypothetical protein
MTESISSLVPLVGVNLSFLFRKAPGRPFGESQADLDKVTPGVTIFLAALRASRIDEAEMARKKPSGGESKAAAAQANRWLPVVIELPPFSHRWGQYRLTEADRSTMLEAILDNPEAWPVQGGTAGARKARFSSHELTSGASGGYRVFYSVFRKYGKVILVTLFPKSMQANLSKAGQKLVATLLREIEQELQAIDREERAKTIRRRK